MAAECVYQYRCFESNPYCVDAGQWGVWVVCNGSKYAEIEKLIDEGQFYQLRVLQVTYVYPTDEHVAEHYKVKRSGQ